MESAQDKTNKPKRRYTAEDFFSLVDEKIAKRDGKIAKLKRDIATKDWWIDFYKKKLMRAEKTLDDCYKAAEETDLLIQDALQRERNVKDNDKLPAEFKDPLQMSIALFKDAHGRVRDHIELYRAEIKRHDV